MEIGFEFVAAQPKKRDYEDEPAQENMRGSRKIMSNPSTDQKKVRRSMTKKQGELTGTQPVAGVPKGTVPEQRHPHGARPFPCKVCHGWGTDAWGQSCYRCHGSGITTTSAMNDSSDCRLCGGGLSGTSGKTHCKECGTEHDLQSNKAKAASVMTAIARRASQVLNTPEENH